MFLYRKVGGMQHTRNALFSRNEWNDHVIHLHQRIRVGLYGKCFTRGDLAPDKRMSFFHPMKPFRNYKIRYARQR
jgi:hypothetical protein